MTKKELKRCPDCDGLDPDCPSPAPSAGLSEEEKEALFAVEHNDCVGHEAAKMLAAIVRRLLPSKPAPSKEANP